MTTTSLPQDSSSILADVEAYISELPEKRRRKRTHAEIYEPDQAPESENYGPEPVPTITIELDDAALTALPVLLHQLGQTRSAYIADLVTAKILDLLGLKLDGGK